MIKDQIVYKYKNNLYLNITNTCPVKCFYCIKYKWKFKFRGYNLSLEKEPTKNQIIKDLSKKIKDKKIKEIVFCGYGEALIRWQLVKNISLWIKKNYPKLKIRVNTSGLVNAYYKKDILKNLKGLIDTISISLNAHNDKVYSLLHYTKIKSPFFEIIKFIKKAKKYFNEVVITTVKNPMINTKAIRNIAKKLNVKLRIRRYLNRYENK